MWPDSIPSGPAAGIRGGGGGGAGASEGAPAPAAVDPGKRQRSYRVHFLPLQTPPPHRPTPPPPLRRGRGLSTRSPSPAAAACSRARRRRSCSCGSPSAAPPLARCGARLEAFLTCASPPTTSTSWRARALQPPPVATPVTHPCAAAALDNAWRCVGSHRRTAGLRG